MSLRATWAVLAGLALGVGLAWWLARDRSGESDRRLRAEQALAEDAADARPKLYRWRDGAGVLHVTAEPPADRPYETVDLEPAEGIEVRGDRD